MIETGVIGAIQGLRTGSGRPLPGPLRGPPIEIAN